MDALSRDIAQRAIDHPLALDARDAGEGLAFDLHRKVRFAAAVIAHVAVMTGAVIDHVEAARGESLCQKLPYFKFDRSGHLFTSLVWFAMCRRVKHSRLHGRYEAQGRECNWPDCPEAGEFRAPGERPPGFDGPGDYRWFCLEHVRRFNAGYDYFDGMTSEEILQAQSPLHGWERENRAFRPTAGVDEAPRWADFADPLDAISGRARAFRNGAARSRTPEQRKDGRPVSTEERRALDTLGLPLDADRRTLRMRYSELVRRYHPDHNGGDRGFESRLQQVVDAYQLLRRARIFA